MNLGEGNQWDERDWLFDQEVQRFGIKENTWCVFFTVLQPLVVAAQVCLYFRESGY